MITSFEFYGLGVSQGISTLQIDPLSLFLLLWNFAGKCQEQRTVLKLPADKLSVSPSRTINTPLQSYAQAPEGTPSLGLPPSPVTQYEYAHFSKKNFLVRSDRRKSCSYTEARLGLPIPAATLSHQAIFTITEESVLLYT